MSSAKYSAPIYDGESLYTGVHICARPKAGSPHPVRPFKWSIAERYALSIDDILKWRTAWCTYRNPYINGVDEWSKCDVENVDTYLDFREQKLREPFNPQHFQMAYTDVRAKEMETEVERSSKGLGTGVGRRNVEPYRNSVWASRVLNRALHYGDDEGRDKMVQEAFSLAGFDMHTKGQESV